MVGCGNNHIPMRRTWHVDRVRIGSLWRAHPDCQIGPIFGELRKQFFTIVNAEIERHIDVAMGKLHQ